MSALTLLSVVAPAILRVPHGAPEEAASGFQHLLTTLSGDDSALSGPGSGSDGSANAEEAPIDGPPAAGFLTAPTTLPMPLVLPIGDAPTTAAGRADDDDAHRLATSGGDGHGGVNPTTPLPTDKGATSKTHDPQVQPRVAETLPPTGKTSDTQLTLAETAAAAEALEARARTGAAPAPQPSHPPLPSPPPLRPLADRTSRPLETAGGKDGDGPRVSDPARPAMATVTAATPTAADQSTRPTDVAVAAAGVRSGEAEAPASELAAPGDGTTAQTQAPAASRETLVSQLSRATIEATAQIAAQILRRLEGRSTRFEMALTPDELGRVDVKLDIDSEGRLNARLAFDNPAAATDLRGRADELRRQLEDAGFHLAEDAFEFADRDSGSSAFDRGQDARNGSSRAFAAASRLNTEIDIAQPPRWLALSLSPSGVDMKV